jgi:methylase of polypeptide subunit release factors
MKYATVTFHTIKVCYLPELDGGGINIAEDFIYQIVKHIGKVNHVFEWCAGPAFIGFALLAQELCDSLTVGDINPKAVEACLETVRQNGLESKVNVFLSDCLQDIPESEQWDLVIGNPPITSETTVHPHLGPRTLYIDEGWAAHKDFYQQVAAHLQPDGNIIVAEHGACSSADTFRTMIEEGGLQLIELLSCQLPSYVYYVWSRKGKQERVEALPTEKQEK